jgi:hypothetical protein
MPRAEIINELEEHLHSLSAVELHRFVIHLHRRNFHLKADEEYNCTSKMFSQAFCYEGQLDSLCYEVKKLASIARGHGYWKDEAYHQLADLKAIREARNGN